MMLRSSANTDQNNKEYHDATGLETPSRAQLPRMLSMTLTEFDERVAEAIRAQTHNLVTSSTANRPNVATPNRPRRGSQTEEATPPRQTSAEVSANGLAYNAVLESVLELDLVLTTSSEIESVKQNQIFTTTVGSNKRFKALHVVGAPRRWTLPNGDGHASQASFNEAKSIWILEAYNIGESRRNIQPCPCRRCHTMGSRQETFIQRHV